MIKQDVFDIRGAVKAEIEKQVKEHLYEIGYQDGKLNTIDEYNEKMHKLYQELGDAYKKIVDLEHKNTGHWLKDCGNFGTYLKCSECGLAYALKNTKNYCPRCGAKMIGDDNE